MKLFAFINRNIKEIIRDPLTLIFGIGFPIILLLLLTAIQSNISISLFEIEQLTPGIVVFGLSFMTLFSATLIAKDRKSALLQRLYVTPLSSKDFIVGYILPILPICIIQTIICYGVAIILGLKITLNILFSIIITIPIDLFFISMGLLCGSVFTDKQVGGICGGLLTNLSVWLSGTCFDLELVGGVFKNIASALPFVHADEIQKAILSGNYMDMLPHFYWIIGYAITITIIAVFAFLKQMKKQ